MYLVGEESHNCLLGVCLLMTYVPPPPTGAVKCTFTSCLLGLELHTASYVNTTGI